MPDSVSHAPSPTLIERGEKLLSPARAAATSNLPGHRGAAHLNASTIFRWIVRGVNTPSGRIRLEAVRVGSSWKTSLEAIARFTARLTEAAIPVDECDTPPGPPTPAARNRAASAASRELDALLGAPTA